MSPAQMAQDGNRNAEGEYQSAVAAEPAGGTQNVTLENPFAGAPMWKLDHDQREIARNIADHLHGFRADLVFVDPTSSERVPDPDFAGPTPGELEANIRASVPHLSPETFGEHFTRITAASDLVDRFDTLDDPADIEDHDDLMFEDFYEWKRANESSDYSSGPVDPDDYAEYTQSQQDEAMSRLDGACAAMVLADATAWGTPWDKLA